MKFPKNQLDINEYLECVKALLCAEECEVFIDTNIISQLYRLNDEARQDFYRWVDSYENRFHIPVWSIHEYSNRVYADKTKDYLEELTKVKTCTKELSNITEFVKGYVGDSLLQGTVYQDNKEFLFSELEQVNTLLNKIATAIKSNLTSHQSKVKREIADKLQPFALDSNIYEIIREGRFEPDLRFEGKVPPGFKDSDKSENRIGDLIIWKEILIYCKRSGVKKAVFISRDCKPDFMYEPLEQKTNGRKASNVERLKIAHESLVYEFKKETQGGDVYIIEFATLVKLIAAQYRNLAISFQIANAQISATENVDLPSDIDLIVTPDQLEAKEPIINIPHSDQYLYSGFALIDEQYDYSAGDGCFDKIIHELKSYNWYIQNPAIVQLIKFKEIQTMEASVVNIDSTFVLGRNITQCAEGSSGNAISFVEHLHTNISDWPDIFKQAFVDGMLYEVFFNSKGEIRSNGFKATYFADMLREIALLSLKDPYTFINSELNKKGKNRFIPIVGGTEQYTFRFDIDNDGYTTNIYCNGIDISETFRYGYYPINFSSVDALKSSLSMYYAIQLEYITIEALPRPVSFITYCTNPLPPIELPF